VVLTNVVVRAVPFQSTVSPFTKAVPFTVRVKPDAPAITDGGEMELIEAGMSRRTRPLNGSADAAVEWIGEINVARAVHGHASSTGEVALTRD
jgi:hypothetical protein